MTRYANLIKTAMDEQDQSANGLQSEIAARYKGYRVSSSSISEVANGNTKNPGAKLLVALCDVLGISYNDACKALREEMQPND